MEPTVFDPGKVLGCSLEEARRLMRGRVVTPGEVEGVALEHYQWRAHLQDPDSYWVTAGQAADILGVSQAEVRELLSEGRLPFVMHRSGVKLMRRHQLREIARHGSLPTRLPTPAGLVGAVDRPRHARSAPPRRHPARPG